MTVKVQLLTRERLPEAVRAFSLQHQIGKQQLSADETQAGIEVLERSLKARNVVTWTAYKDEVFAGYLVQQFIEAEGHWLMPFLVTNPDQRLPWNYSKNCMEQLWARAMGFGRLRNRLNVLWSMPVSWTRTTTKTQRSSPVWQEYVINTYAVIPAGELPANQFDRIVFGEKPKSYDVALRVAWPSKHDGEKLFTEQRERLA